MISVSESAKILKAYLDESAGSIPPKVYGAISTAVAVMQVAYAHADVFGGTLDAIDAEGADGR